MKSDVVNRNVDYVTIKKSEAKKPIDYDEVFQEYLKGNSKVIDELLKRPVKELKRFADSNCLTFKSRKQFRTELLQWLKIRKGIEVEL